MSHLPSIRVSTKNPHALETDDGKPFFMLGDTAWTLTQRLELEEVRAYFAVRKRQHFNMIWIVALTEFDGLRVPGRNGQVPFHDLDPSRPNNAYFEWLDWIIDEAERQGLYIGLLPTWGDKLTAPWGIGPAIFKDAIAIEAYGRFLARRYKDSTHLLWVVGGDRPARIPPGGWMEKNAEEVGIDPRSDWTPLWRALAEGILAEIPSAVITYHPQGGSDSTSKLIPFEPWLHINSIQSGHGDGRDVPAWECIEHDYAMFPIKPTFDAEPNYEDHPVSPWPSFNPQNGYFEAYDVRRQCWRTVFAGGCGVIYGHHSIWQFASEHQPWINHARMSWKDALQRPGAEQMRHLRSFMEEAPLRELVPDQSLLLGVTGEQAEHKRAIRSSDMTFVAVYEPQGAPISLDPAVVDGKVFQWYDPRTGYRSPAIGQSACGATVFQPTSALDWVLELRSREASWLSGGVRHEHLGQ